ncbi:MAG: 1-deoxy-D-xylulose-5-phosphate reductoisomerase [Gammaproteobacteria bacterium]|nr:1-deoxy-D-xylulose-5-phosphate reductoisomerase [Gammaproteobacteria bacterium]MDE2252429.1 1-deoxy-D-xylulose-5-phosphate reductoisomerase [Gammaproteobacteria bacterium]
MIGVAILGATGSIGRNTLDVLERHPDIYRVVSLAARSDARRLAELCLRHRPEVAAMEQPDAAAELERRLREAGSAVRVTSGPGSIEALARDGAADVVMAAISGAAGLRSTLAAAASGKRLLLANKESVVMAGDLLLAAVRAGNATLIPIDSEHNAIFQCLPTGARIGERPAGVRRLLLTASGGPFLEWTAAAMAAATPEQACAHPRWSMGRKISVDSATLMNKGLELIEATVLFGMEPRDVTVVVHPQSVVHSLVEFVDGSTLAQLSAPDMRTPIAHGLAWPGRVSAGVEFLDLAKVGALEFRAPDRARFPCLALAEAAARAGGAACAWLNAADEVAVQAFLDKQLNFEDIPRVIEGVMHDAPGGSLSDLDEVFAADGAARLRARAELGVCRDRVRSSLA